MPLVLRVALTASLFALPVAGAERDVHSFATPKHVRVRHIDLDLTVDFAARTLRGTAMLLVERASADTKKPLVLDTRGLAISEVEGSSDCRAFARAPFELGQADPVLGQPLTIQLPDAVQAVRVTYATGPKAAALQWLSPKQTAGKKHPLLFTQSQAIDARSWVPLQDTPGVRFTYTARVRTPKDCSRL
jgi:aminopeptidase N